MDELLGTTRLESIPGDITAQHDLGAVVNAANAELMPGGGVAGAIHRAAGPDLVEACRPLAPIRPGQAVITPGFNLPNDWIIHCLGPRYGIDEPADERLADCYRNALYLAEEKGVASLGFPALSTGAFGYPLESASEVALKTVRAEAGALERVCLVRFIFFSDKDRRTFDMVWERLGKL